MNRENQSAFASKPLNSETMGPYSLIDQVYQYGLSGILLGLDTYQHKYPETGTLAPVYKAPLRRLISTALSSHDALQPKVNIGTPEKVEMKPLTPLSPFEQHVLTFWLTAALESGVFETTEAFDQNFVPPGKKDDDAEQFLLKYWGHLVTSFATKELPNSETAEAFIDLLSIATQSKPEDDLQPLLEQWITIHQTKSAQIREGFNQIANAGKTVSRYVKTWIKEQKGTIKTKGCNPVQLEHLSGDFINYFTRPAIIDEGILPLLNTGIGVNGNGKMKIAAESLLLLQK